MAFPNEGLIVTVTMWDILPTSTGKELTPSDFLPLVKTKTCAGSSHAAADKSNLHYVAFGDRGILLENAGILVQRMPSLRDPGNKIIDSRLRTLVFKGSVEPVNCGSTEPVGSKDARANCAIKAFAERTPF